MRIEDVRRGQVYMVCLDPVFGREMGGFKMRPVVVVSIDDINEKTRLITVVPGTTTPARFRNIVGIQPSDANGLESETFFQCHQVRAIERGRLTGRAIGILSRDDFRRIEKSLAHCMGQSMK
jgi:mRNA-degrading endonuclease toxin of MazEF toxin-antitoxin module